MNFARQILEFGFLMERPIATSKAPKILVLGMFRLFGIIGQKMDQI